MAGRKAKSGSPNAQPKYGDKFQGEQGIVKVMCVVDNYVMVRYKGCMPFVVYLADFLKRFAPVP